MMLSAPRRVPRPTSGVPFAKTAPHIRGRVFARGATWHMEVVNTRTGRVLARDNTNSRAVMLADAHQATAAARAAWSYALRRKDLL